MFIPEIIIFETLVENLTIIAIILRIVGLLLNAIIQFGINFKSDFLNDSSRFLNLLLYGF